MSTKKIALITGPTSGIGKVTALELAKRGFNLILLARNPKKADKLQLEIGDKAETAFVECDLPAWRRCSGPSNRSAPITAISTC